MLQILVGFITLLRRDCCYQRGCGQVCCFILYR